MELLSLMAVMSGGLGFNLCVAPFLNICVLNFFIVRIVLFLFNIKLRNSLCVY